MQRLANTWAIFQGLLIESLPFLLLGVAIAALARWLVPQAAWVRRLPRNPLLAPVVGALLGFALPACECGNVPVARRLLASGAPLGTGFGFLFAAPVLNPIVLASTWAAFPDQPWLLVARPLGAFLIALALSALLGLLGERALLVPALLEERRLSQPLAEVGLLERGSGVLGAESAPLSSASTSASKLSLVEVLHHSSREFLGLLVLLVVGCGLAAAVQAWLPRDPQGRAATNTPAPRSPSPRPKSSWKLAAAPTTSHAITILRPLSTTARVKWCRAPSKATSTGTWR